MHELLKKLSFGAVFQVASAPSNSKSLSPSVIFKANSSLRKGTTQIIRNPFRDYL